MYQRSSRVKVFVLICIMLALASLACSLQKAGISSTSDEKTTSKDSSNAKEESLIKELTAQEILDKSTEAMKNVKTMSLQFLVTTGSAGISFEINGEGVMELPDKSYIKMDYAGQIIEVLTLSKTEAYMRQPGSTTWETIDISQLNQPGGMNVDVTEQLIVVDFTDEINLASPEPVDSVNCFHITFSVDMAQYLSELGEAGAQIDAATSKGTGELWIGTDDFLTRKFLFTLDAAVQGVTFTGSTEITMSKFNEPVEIPIP
jgi:hypothetical protein